MTLIDDRLKPTRRAGVWLRRSRDENAVYDPKTGRLHLLNDTAAAIWDLCDGETTASEMITAVCELCGMHIDVVTEDVERILHDFERAGLVTWIN